jgi:hypothetical protein
MKKAPKGKSESPGACTLDRSEKSNSKILQKGEVKVFDGSNTRRTMTVSKYQNPLFGPIGK